jgi:hypothetical protein
MAVNDFGQPKISRGSTSSLGKWLLGGVLCALVIGLIGFFGLYHLVFGISLANLSKPYGIISVLTLFTFAAMYWANMSSRPSGRLKRRAAVVGAFMCLTSIVGVQYAARAGVMPVEDVVGLSIFMTTGM